ncbi:uncharacterized protein [Amphiura filiformis]|uniref:uncharacterized protein n=1 Tax=Amphiura filiformis TaxID=82378 RepID=UPI003B227D85
MNSLKSRHILKTLVALCCFSSTTGLAVEPADDSIVPIDPVCKCPAPPPSLPQFQLTEEQLASIDHERIRELQSNPALLEAANEKGQTIIQLTSEQEKAVYVMNPSLFQPNPGPAFEIGLDPQPEYEKAALYEASSLYTSPWIRKCPAVESMETLTLAINKDGVLVQVIQPTSGSGGQWVLNEKCRLPYETCSPSCQYAYLICRNVVRYVSVLALDFGSNTSVPSFHQIRVYCCAAHTFSWLF